MDLTEDKLTEWRGLKPHELYEPIVYTLDNVLGYYDREGMTRILKRLRDIPHALGREPASLLHVSYGFDHNDSALGSLLIDLTTGHLLRAGNGKLNLKGSDVRGPKDQPFQIEEDQLARIIETKRRAIENKREQFPVMSDEKFKDLCEEYNLEIGTFLGRSLTERRPSTREQKELPESRDHEVIQNMQISIKQGDTQYQTHQEEIETSPKARSSEKPTEREVKEAKVLFRTEFQAFQGLYMVLNKMHELQKQSFNLDRFNLSDLYKMHDILDKGAKHIQDAITSGYDTPEKVATQKYETLKSALEKIRLEPTSQTEKSIEQKRAEAISKAKDYIEYINSNYANNDEKLEMFIYHINRLLKEINFQKQQKLQEICKMEKELFNRIKELSPNKRDKTKEFKGRYVTKWEPLSNLDRFFLQEHMVEGIENYVVVKSWPNDMAQTERPPYRNYVNLKERTMAAARNYKPEDRTQAEKVAEESYHLACEEAARGAKRREQTPEVPQRPTIGAFKSTDLLLEQFRWFAQEQGIEESRIKRVIRCNIINEDTEAVVAACCERLGLRPGEKVKLIEGSELYYSMYDTPNGNGMPYLLNRGEDASGKETILEIELVVPEAYGNVPYISFLFGEK